MAIGLPRTTSYRILETLCGMGLAVRDDATDRYRLTLKVRSLADGFDDEAWVSTLAKPLESGYQGFEWADALASSALVWGER